MKSLLKSSIPADKVRSFAMDSKATEKTLDLLGIHYDARALDEFRAYATDALPDLQTSPSNMTPIQFLQVWVPEMVAVVTAALDADSILGRDFLGSWEDEEIVQPVIEYTGQARAYGDKTTLNLADFNMNYETRTIVRFEQDVEVGKLEAARAAKQRVDAMGAKRYAAAQSLAINANAIAFNGYYSGINKTYGLLNDPNLPNYGTLATGSAGSTTFATKTFNEIIADFKTMISALRVKTGNNFKPESEAFTVAFGPSVMESMYTTNQLGNVSVLEWLKKTYPQIRIATAVQLDNANSGANVIYIFADRIAGQKVIAQYMQDALRLVGVEQKAKGAVESYSNATAGTFLRVPLGLVRYTGC